MQIKNKKISKKKILWLSVPIILTLLLLGIFGAYSFSLWPFTNKNNPPHEEPSPTQQPITTPKPNKDNDQKGQDYVDEPDNSVQGDASLTITRLTQSNGEVVIESDATNVSAGGRCIVYLTANIEGSSVSEYMATSSHGSTTTCSVSIDELKFTYLGRWAARIVYTTPDNKKVEATGHIEIR